jgi:formylglycine-generating enzyme required for sulfatase activity
MKKSMIFIASIAMCASVMKTNCGNSQHHPAEPEMIFVQGGTFIMGCTSEQGSDCDADESPKHQVKIDDFHIGKYEVTQSQWEAVMGTSVRQQRDKADTSWPIAGEGKDYPMYYVSWNEVQEFIGRLNKATGKNYRLPTESEWEYAARGGAKSKGYKYSGSNMIEDVAWNDSNSGSQTQEVGLKRPNELGIYDMSGNVWEWCYDWYADYGSSYQTNPVGPSSGSYRVLRGGSWYINAWGCRVSFRYLSAPDSRYLINGFRLALSL